MNLRRGDIVTAAFPGDLKKPRPAVILQADEFIEGHRTVLACPFSTYLAVAPVSPDRRTHCRKWPGIPVSNYGRQSYPCKEGGHWTGDWSSECRRYGARGNRIDQY